MRCGSPFSMRPPLKRIVPSVTRASSMPWKPEMARNSVVLPAPLVPRMPTIWPWRADSVMPCTAVIAR